MYDREREITFTKKDKNKYFDYIVYESPTAGKYYKEKVKELSEETKKAKATAAKKAAKTKRTSSKRVHK